RRDPLHHQFGIVYFFHLRYPSRATDYMNAVARRNRTGMEKSRTLVLVATMRSPTIGSPDQTYLRARCAKLGRPRRATAPDFPACAASQKGTKELIWVHGQWSGDMMMDGVPDVRAGKGVRPLNLSGKSTQQRGGDRRPAGAGRRHRYGQGTCATHG